MYTDVAKLKFYAAQINKELGLDVVKYRTPRSGGYQLPSITGKIEGGIDGFSVIVHKVFGKSAKVEKLTGDIANRISGTYDSFIVTLSNTEGFYFRSIIGERGNLTDKDLTPSKLKVDGKILTKQTFDEQIEHGLAFNKDLPIEILHLAKELLSVCSNTGTSIKTNPQIVKLISSITSTDLKKFGKNFGEVIIAKWCLYNKKNAISVFFPEKENNPLADFIINFTPASNMPPLNISAKFKQGANASLNSIIPKGCKPPVGATDIELKAFNAIMEIAYGSSILEGLLNAEILLDTPEYKIIKKMCGGGIVTLQSISDLVENTMTECGITKNTSWGNDQYRAFLKKMEPFYNLIQGKGSGKLKIDSFKKILASPPGKYFHPILYAFSVALAYRFNNNIEFSSVLDKAATSIKAEQLYLDISSQTINIKLKEFEKSQFKFTAGALAYKADNTRMKVEMIK